MKKALSLFLSVLMCLSVFSCIGGVKAEAAGTLNYIKYEHPDGKFSLCEKTNGYWSYEFNADAGEYERVFIYEYFDLWQDGAVIELDYFYEPSDLATYIYTCVDGVFVDERGNELDESELYYYTEQGENPWAAGTYSVVVCYGDKECSVPVEITESPVEAVEFIPAKAIELRQGVDGYGYYFDDEENGFYYDYEGGFLNEGNMLKVTFKDGTDSVYTSDGDDYLDASGNAVSVDLIVDAEIQEMTHWNDLGEYYAEYYFMGCKFNVPVTVVENPVESVEFIIEKPIKYYENTNGMYIDDEESVFLYDMPLYIEGTAIKVNFYDGTSEVYSYDSDEEVYLNENGEILEAGMEVESDQDDAPWGVGEHSFILTVYGKTCSIPVKIVENPITEFEFKPAEPLVFTYAEGGEWITSYDDNGEEIEFYYYDSSVYSPYEDGNAITLTLKDGSVVTYTYDAGEKAFLDGNGKAMPYDDEILYVDVQFFIPWDEASAYNFMAVEFMGSYNVVPVVIENGVPATADAPYVYNGAGKICVEWEPVAGATEYWVFRKVGSQKSWQCVAKTDGYIYEDVSGIKDGQTYKYTVYGVNSNGNGGFSKAGTAIEYIAPVGGVKLENVNGNIKISWADYEGVTCHVFRASESDSDWVYVASAEGSGYYVLDPDAQSGEEYTYTVVASRNGFESGYETHSIKCIATPVLKSASNTTDGVTVKWGAVDGAEGYRVYRKGATGGWIFIGTTTKTSYTDKAVANKSGNTYKYTVKAVSGKFASGYNKSGISIKRVATAELSSIANVTSGVNLKWGAVKGATEYRVYRRVAGTADWTLITKTTATSYTDTAVKSKSGVKYEYTIRAYSGKTAGDFNREGWSVLRLSSPVLKSAENYPTGGKVTWSAVKGANSYVVYRKTNSTGWKRLAVVDGNSNTSYIDEAAESGILYTYTVRAANGKTMSSYYSTGVSLKYLAAPVATAKVTASGVSLKWNKPVGAKTFRVYRKATGGEWTVLKDTTSTSFVDKTAKSGVAYTYAVRAINGKVISNLRKVNVDYMATPTVNSVANKQAGIEVKWGKVAGAEGYRVYRKTGNGSWENLQDVAPSVVSFLDKTAVEGKTYSYTVRAFKGKAFSSYVSSSQLVRVPEPAMNSLVNVADGVRVSWYPVGTADKYYIYRRIDGEGWSRIAIVNKADVQTDEHGNLIYVDKTPVNGTVYSYTVRAYDNGSLSSFYANRYVTYFDAVDVTSAKSGATGITVKWEKCQGADSYLVLRKQDGDDGYSILTSVSADKTSFVDKNVSSGEKYTYIVEAFGGPDGKQGSSAPGQSKTCIAK